MKVYWSILLGVMEGSEEGRIGQREKVTCNTESSAYVSQVLRLKISDLCNILSV